MYYVCETLFIYDKLNLLLRLENGNDGLHNADLLAAPRLNPHPTKHLRRLSVRDVPLPPGMEDGVPHQLTGIPGPPTGMSGTGAITP